MSDLVGRVVREQSRRMAGHPIEVAFPETSLKVRGDPELLSMALVQFLDNAAKYSFAGQKVKVSAWESHSEVTISVHNFGPAIPISERERIFQRFYRSEGSKAMAEGHRRRTVNGEDGGRSAPRPYVGHQRRRRGNDVLSFASAGWKEIRLNENQSTVLIVDDEPSIRISLRTILSGLGFAVVEAARGEEAVSLGSDCAL